MMKEGTAYFIGILLAILLPPLGVFRKFGFHKMFWVCLLLSVFTYLPGLIFVIYVIPFPFHFHSHPLFSALPSFLSYSNQAHSPLPLNVVHMETAFQEITSLSGPLTSSSKKACYDVFINHHGKDVKRKLASTIYNMLDLMGVQAFLDKEELELGDSFPQAIEEAMRSASVHIAIFSPSYAESPWCLEELSLMIQINITIIPVFYGVDPCDLRYVAKGKGKYADAFVRHRRQRRYSLKKIEEWEEALSRISYVSGSIVDEDKCDEGELLREIVQTAHKKMNKVPLGFGTSPVGLDEIVQDFQNEVGSPRSENVHIVGIVGMGGSGKTTLAKELYNRRCSSIRSSFLCNIREAASSNTLPQLQENLMKDLGIQQSAFHNIHQGMGMLARGLNSMTVLIVLDDVDHFSQIEALLPQEMMHNLGSGSFIIVTTREVDVLTSWGVSSVYHMKPLDFSKAKQLFCMHAFLQPYSKPGFEHLLNYFNFEDLIKRFVEACNGLPLSLKVLGAMVNGRSAAYWEDQLLKIPRILPKDIAKSLKLSYDALDGEVQKMFLDVACFFIGETKSMVVDVWEGSGWSGEVGLQTLVDKCLVRLDDVYIEMHDHLRDLGRQIAENVSPSRIWKQEQLTNIQGGRSPIRGIWIGWSHHYDEVRSYPALRHFMEKIMKTEPMPALQLLLVTGDEFREDFEPLTRDLICLGWNGFKGTKLPSWISLKNLRVLEFREAKNLKELWHDDVDPPLQLRQLNIFLRWGTSFRFPRSIGRLRHLKRLQLEGKGIFMRSLPEEFCCLESLEFLKLSNLQGLSSLPDEFGKLRNLRTLKLWCLELTAMPNSFKNLTALESIDIYSCSKLKKLPALTTLVSLRELNLNRFNLWELPNNIGQLTKLETLTIDVDGLTFVELGLGMESPSACNLRSLKFLWLSHTRVCRISISDDCCPRLESLQLSFNKNLTEIETMPGNVREIVVYQCKRLKNMKGIGGLQNLRRLRVEDCPALEVLPCLAYMHSEGHELTIKGCPKVGRPKRKIVEVLSKEEQNKEMSKGKQKIDESEEESDESTEEYEEESDESTEYEVLEWSTEEDSNDINEIEGIER